MNSRNYMYHQAEQARVRKLYQETVQVLKDLIRVNKDRITGYEKAAGRENSLHPDLPNTLSRMATESRSYVNDLHAEVIRLGGTPVTQETIMGKIYLFWLDLKVDFDSGSGGGGEEAMQKAYRQALQQGEALPDPIIQLLERQLGALEKAQERIKEFNL